MHMQLLHACNPASINAPDHMGTHDLRAVLHCTSGIIFDPAANCHGPTRISERPSNTQLGNRRPPEGPPRPSLGVDSSIDSSHSVKTSADVLCRAANNGWCDLEISRWWVYWLTSMMLWG